MIRKWSKKYIKKTNNNIRLVSIKKISLYIIPHELCLGNIQSKNNNDFLVIKLSSVINIRMMNHILFLKIKILTLKA